jgi:hypothetical protein
MIGWTTMPGMYVSLYYGMAQGEEKWGQELKDKIQLKKVTLLPNCQSLQCNPLKMIINDPHSTTTDLSVLRCYGLEAKFIGNTHPIGSFFLELLKEPAATATSNALSPTLCYSSIIVFSFIHMCIQC